jgi:hypothetical protein
MDQFVLPATAVEACRLAGAEAAAADNMGPGTARADRGAHVVQPWLSAVDYRRGPSSRLPWASSRRCRFHEPSVNLLGPVEMTVSDRMASLASQVVRRSGRKSKD